jgi:hypothetical protein
MNKSKFKVTETMNFLVVFEYTYKPNGDVATETVILRVPKIDAALLIDALAAFKPVEN